MPAEEFTSHDETPFGRGGDWCAYCGADWKEMHVPGCIVTMRHDFGDVLSANKVRCGCGLEFKTEPHPEPGHWESPALDVHRAEMKEMRS